MLTDDATLTYMKAGYLEGDKPSSDDAIELIEEIKRLRAELKESEEDNKFYRENQCGCCSRSF